MLKSNTCKLPKVKSISTLITELQDLYRQEAVSAEQSSVSGQRLVYPESTARVALVDRTRSQNITEPLQKYY